MHTQIMPEWKWNAFLPSLSPLGGEKNFIIGKKQLITLAIVDLNSWPKNINRYFLKKPRNSSSIFNFNSKQKSVINRFMSMQGIRKDQGETYKRSLLNQLRATNCAAQTGSVQELRLGDPTAWREPAKVNQLANQSTAKCEDFCSTTWLNVYYSTESWSANAVCLLVRRRWLYLYRFQEAKAFTRCFTPTSPQRLQNKWGALLTQHFSEERGQITVFTFLTCKDEKFWTF